MEGKTINQLIRIENVAGDEIIPIAVFNNDVGTYVTRGIKFNDMVAKIVAAIEANKNAIAAQEGDTEELEQATKDLLNKTTELETSTEQLNKKSDALFQVTDSLTNATINLKNTTETLTEKTSELEEATEDLEDKTVELIEKTTYLVGKTIELVEKTDDISYQTEELENRVDGISYDLTYLSTYTSAAFAYNDIVDAEQEDDLEEVSYAINDPFTSF